MTETPAGNGTPRTALVVEGGAMRGVFSCGVLDRFAEADFYPFDLCIGVSAGASNVAAYLARAAGRNLRVYTEYSLRPEFLNWWRGLRGGHFLDLDWLWEETVRELPLNLDTLFGQPAEFLVGVTCADTGKGQFLRPERDDFYEVLKASSALPVAYRDTVTVRGRRWADGGVTNSIPVREAHQMGARRIMVLRSRPRSYEKPMTLSDRIMPSLLRHRPAVASAMAERHVTYRANLAFIRDPPPGVEVVEVCTPEDFPVGRSTKDRAALEQGWTLGYQAAEAVMRGWDEGS